MGCSLTPIAAQHINRRDNMIDIKAGFTIADLEAWAEGTAGLVIDADNGKILVVGIEA